MYKFHVPVGVSVCGCVLILVSPSNLASVSPQDVLANYPFQPKPLPYIPSAKVSGLEAVQNIQSTMAQLPTALFGNVDALSASAKRVAHQAVK